MGHNQDGAGKPLQIVLQNREGHHIQIVGRLVQQQHVGRSHQNGQQIQPPPFAAAEPPDGDGLQVAGKEEPLHHGFGGKGSLVGAYLVADLMDEIVDPLVQIQLPPLL